MGTLYIDCSNGARKESLACMLYDMLDDDAKASFIDRFNSAGFEGMTMRASRDGIVIEHDGMREREWIASHSDHGHTHHHAHRNLADVVEIINASHMTDRAKSHAAAIYELIAGAEAAVHGAIVADVHFHEVGNMFAISYVSATSMLVDLLDPSHVEASSIATGFGFIDCAHGRLSIPAPATARLLEGLPWYHGDVEGELCTPTGATIVRHFAESFTDGRRSVLDTGFAKKFIETAQRSWDLGWHERNGGNMSYRLCDHEAADIAGELDPGEWIPIGGDVEAPLLAGEHFMITAAGSFFSNTASDPAHTLGIIELDEAGKSYRICWGFEGGGRPTSELPSHLLVHEAKVREGSQARVLHHSHPADVAALTFVLPLTPESLTRVLWQMISECAIVFPEGVGVVEWMVPGSIELGRATAEQMRGRNVVIWPHHGLICCEQTFDLALGLAHTIAKAAEIYIKARSAGAEVNPDGTLRQSITAANLRQMAEVYKLPISSFG